jgi:tRNA-Thr(GGU) m(6)t(6)A37 methyltransferase TsaA
MGELVFHPPYRSGEALRGIEGFSHLWLIFGFHETAAQGWKPTVRPPRLGGNQRVGVFASRSTFRPNALGLSVVRLERVDSGHPEGPVLVLGGVDLLDGTPVYDVKPYLAYADSIPEASAGFAGAEIPRLEVRVSEQVFPVFATLPPRAQALIREALSLDPRPAVRRHDSGRVFGALLWGWEVKFQIERDCCEIVGLHPAPPNPGAANESE